MTILVTGGAGFIGGNFIYYELERHPQDRIVCLDSLTYAGNISTLKAALADPRFRFVRGDISDRPLVESLVSGEKPDIIVNFAAETHVDRSVLDPGAFVRSNIVGTQVLMDACRKYGVGRYHQVSTDEVYGDLPLDRPDLLFREDSPIHASSPYSAAKAGADLMVQAYHRTFGLPVTITRCSNNYGAYQFPEKMIPLMITRAINDEPLPVYGDGLNVRDWLHVSDHCAAIDVVMRSGRPGEIYNVGGHNEKNNLEVVRAILRVLGKPESLIRFVSDRPGHDRRYAIDPTKIGRDLGWRPLIRFDDGIAAVVDWYARNREWWTAILSGEYSKYAEEMYGARLREAKQPGA